MYPLTGIQNTVKNVLIASDAVNAKEAELPIRKMLLLDRLPAHMDANEMKNSGQTPGKGAYLKAIPSVCLPLSLFLSLSLNLQTRSKTAGSSPTREHTSRLPLRYLSLSLSFSFSLSTSSCIKLFCNRKTIM